MQERAFNHATRDELEKFKDQLIRMNRTLVERTGYTHHIKTHLTGIFALVGLFILVGLAANFGLEPQAMATWLMTHMTHSSPR
jgi:hypothetical protein